MFEYDQRGSDTAVPNSAAGNAGLSSYENRRGILIRTVTRQYVWLDDAAGARPIALLQPKSEAEAFVPERALAAVAGETGRAAAQALRTDVFAIVADHTGAPRAMVGKGQRVVWRAQVLGYGKASPGADNLLSLNLLGSNQYFDQETQLHYNVRRYLEPASGRYLSADPLGLVGGSNRTRLATTIPSTGSIRWACNRNLSAPSAVGLSRTSSNTLSSGWQTSTPENLAMR